MRRVRSSIRLKLTIATLVPLVTAISVCWVIGASVITTRLFSQAQQKVETDLNAAHEMFLGELAHLSDIIRLTGQSPELSADLADSRPAVIGPPLQATLRNERLSFLTLVDRYGFVRYRAANPGLRGGPRLTEKIVAAALGGTVASGIVMLPADLAGRENPDLPPRMAIPIRSTPHSRRYVRQVEDRGLFLVAAAPIIARDGSVADAIYGGILLNGDNQIVDRITRVVFQKGEGAGRSTGNSTLFLDDVRIATSVRDSQGKRAIGSTMSEEVYAAISRGAKWIGKAFVLNDRYFSAYEPLRDSRGSVVGALYVGMPEEPFLQLRTRINLVFAGVLVFVTLIGVSLSAWLSASMARPVSALVEGVRRIGAGERLPDIAVESHDEIAALAGEFNAMKRQLEAREEENRALNRTLEEKVAVRTAELEEKNRLLVRTQEELVRAARLAELGTLAAGVAHEINNPLAVIRGNSELLQMALAEDDPSRDEVETIARQVVRMERIVGNLLRFARREQKRLGHVAIPPLLDEIIDQVRHQVPLDNVTIHREFAPELPSVEGDGEQIRQVFTNLILNGIQAMPDGGTLSLAVFPGAEDAIVVEVSDDGHGISEAALPRIFDPFFTTKPTGTGLGLAVSYGIVRDHGGTIGITATSPAGTTFRVTLPVGLSAPA